MKKLFRGLRKILKPALPIAGALLGGWAGGKIGGMLGGALGGKVGRIAGGVVGGLVGASAGGMRLQDQYSTQVMMPPYAQKGAQILENLLGQSSQFAQTIANTRRPYLEQAKASFENLQYQIPSLFDNTFNKVSSIFDRAEDRVSSVFGKSKSEVSSLYENLLSRTQDIIKSEQTKQNARLGALGLLNTQAQQWTMADILNRTAFPVLERKTDTLASLVGAETKTLTDFTKARTDALTNLAQARTDALLRYLFARPEFYMRLGDEMVATNSFLLEQQYKMDIAKAMMGVPTIVQPIYQRGLLRDLLPIAGLAGIELLKYRLLK